MNHSGPDTIPQVTPCLDEDALYAKVAWRLLPFLFVCYVAAYLDRVNVGFAKLEMLEDLAFSEVVYGLGAGVFFIGYFIFEVPSNVLLHRMGARVCLARIMVSWGLISAAMMFVTTPASFYTLRFLLGVAEAGFFPGVILYLTYWFPAARRGRITALFVTAVAISGVIGSPLSGLIMESMDGVRGWAGWQWLFLLEGLPSVLLGLFALAYLDDGIAEARWLSADEKALLAARIAADDVGKVHHRILDGMREPQVWLLSAIYFCFVMGLYGINFWLPTIVRALGVEQLRAIGMVSAVPFAAAAVVMVAVGRSADRRRERRWHIVVPAALGALGLLGSVALAEHPRLAVAALTLGTCGVLSAIPLCWSLATAFLAGGAAAAGIAFINSFGNLSGFVGPYLVGWITAATGSTDGGVVMLAGFLLLGAALVLFRVPAGLVNR